jgi:hypothetical protein
MVLHGFLPLHPYLRPLTRRITHSTVPRTAASRRAIAEHLARSGWLRRASKLVGDPARASTAALRRLREERVSPEEFFRGFIEFVVELHRGEEPLHNLFFEEAPRSSRLVELVAAINASPTTPSWCNSFAWLIAFRPRHRLPAALADDPSSAQTGCSELRRTPLLGRWVNKALLVCLLIPRSRVRAWPQQKM